VNLKTDGPVSATDIPWGMIGWSTTYPGALKRGPVLFSPEIYLKGETTHHPPFRDAQDSSFHVLSELLPIQSQYQRTMRLKAFGALRPDPLG
jgi:hypothetical protein